MLTREVVTTVTVRCATCKKPVSSAAEHSKHLREHTMERLYSTQDGLRYIQEMKGILHDRPDHQEGGDRG